MTDEDTRQQQAQVARNLYAKARPASGIQRVRKTRSSRTAPNADVDRFLHNYARNYRETYKGRELPTEKQIDKKCVERMLKTHGLHMLMAAGDMFLGYVPRDDNYVLKERGHTVRMLERMLAAVLERFPTETARQATRYASGELPRWDPQEETARHAFYATREGA